MSVSKTLFLLLLFIGVRVGLSADTLFTNPNYPPLVYSSTEYDFYKYTPRFVPSSLFQAFKILGTSDKEALTQFAEKSEDAVIQSGIYFSSSRLRREFCLEGYSEFVLYFHERGIYYPYAMESYILLCFHQYIRQERIDWMRNKSMALNDYRKPNRKWKKRSQKLFDRKGKVKSEKTKAKKSKQNTEKKEDTHNSMYPDELFWGEFNEED